MEHWLIQRFKQQKEMPAIVEQSGTYLYEQLAEKVELAHQT